MPLPQLQCRDRHVETLGMADDDRFQAWMREGLTNGWITEPFCATHDGPPMSDEEFDDDDVCVYCVRLQD